MLCSLSSKYVRHQIGDTWKIGLSYLALSGKDFVNWRLLRWQFPIGDLLAHVSLQATVWPMTLLCQAPFLVFSNLLKSVGVITQVIPATLPFSCNTDCGRLENKFKPVLFWISLMWVEKCEHLLGWGFLVSKLLTLNQWTTPALLLLVKTPLGLSSSWL